jgi:hypothetical protein
MFCNMRAGARVVAGEEGGERQQLVRRWLVSSWLVCVVSTPPGYCTQQQKFGALKWTTGGWGSRGAPRVRWATTHCFQHGHKLRNATTPQGPRWREGGGRRQGCGGDLIVHSQPNLSPRKHMCREGNKRLYPTEGAGSRQAAELRRARTGFHPISIFVRVALVVAAGEGRRGGGEQGG